MEQLIGKYDADPSPPYNSTWGDPKGLLHPKKFGFLGPGLRRPGESPTGGLSDPAFRGPVGEVYGV